MNYGLQKLDYILSRRGIQKLKKGEFHSTNYEPWTSNYGLIGLKGIYCCGQYLGYINFSAKFFRFLQLM